MVPHWTAIFDSSRAVVRIQTVHHAFSAYITALPTALWSQPGRADHNVTRVVSGVADTALKPAAAAQATVKIIEQLWE